METAIHKVFVGHHHQRDQQYKEAPVGLGNGIPFLRTDPLTRMTFRMSGPISRFVARSETGIPGIRR